MNSSPDDVTQASLIHKKLELGNKRQQKIEGLLRSRANWHENGEKCSEYFCKLEKEIFIKKTITELIDENGQHITDQSEILLEQQFFFFFIKLYIQVGISMIMMSHSLIMTLNLQRIKKTYVRET